MDYWWLRRHWSYIVARWLEILWWCRCSYSNIATDRCRLCGSRPPRPVRDELASVPLPPRRDLSKDQRITLAAPES